MLFDQLKAEVDVYVASVHEGEIEARPVYAELKKIETLINVALASIKNQTIEEQSHYGSQQTELNGVKMEIMNAGGRWEYKHLSDHVLLTDRVKKFEAEAQKNGTAIKSQSVETIKCTFRL
jgi:hypothetical protein